MTSPGLKPPGAGKAAENEAESGCPPKSSEKALQNVQPVGSS